MAGERQPGWWYPWIFVGCMALVVAVNAVLVFFALDTWSGLGTRDHYNKGLAYNEALAAADTQARRGWRWSLAFAPHPTADGERRGDFAVTLTDRDGNPLERLEVTAALIRPTHEGFDVSVALDNRGGGVYGAEIALPLPGQWDARIHARGGPENFQATRRVVVR